MKKQISIFALLACVVLSCQAAKNSLTAEDFFSRSEINTPELSPDGKHIAYLKSTKDKEYSLCTFNLETKETKEFKAEKNQGIYRFDWLNDETIIFRVYPKLGRIRSNKFTSSGTYSVNINNPDQLAVLNLKSSVSFVDRIPQKPTQFWMKTSYWKGNRSNVKRKDALIKYDISQKSPDKGRIVTKVMTLGAPVESIPSPMNKLGVYWIADLNSEPRIVKFLDQNSSEYTYHRYVPENDDWPVIPLDPIDWTIHGFYNENQVIVSGFGDNPYKTVFLYDINTTSFVKTLYEDPNADVNPHIHYRLNDGKKEFLGITYTHDRKHHYWTSTRMKSIQQGLDATFEELNPTITSFSNDLEKMIVSCNSPTQPHEYYICQPNKGEIKLFSKSKPNIDPQMLSPVFRFNFKTNDALTLNAYLTNPKHSKAKQPPMVVLIHGGPHARDCWLYSREVQFLASLGYSVLQVNYRGSDGYGKEIYEKYGYKYDLMVEDVERAIDLVVKKGIVDPNRIALMGASFGAYSSVYLASKNPDNYRCMIATSGIYDFRKHLNDLKKGTFKGKRYSGSYKFLSEKLGDPKKNKAYLDSISPINFAHRIKCPTLVVHGTDDSITSHKESKALIRILKPNVDDLEYYFEYDEGHGFFEEDTRIKYYNRVANFLNKYLPVKLWKQSPVMP